MANRNEAARLYLQCPYIIKISSMSEGTQVKRALSASDGCNSGTCAAGTALVAGRQSRLLLIVARISVKPVHETLNLEFFFKRADVQFMCPRRAVLVVHGKKSIGDRA